MKILFQVIIVSLCYVSSAQKVEVIKIEQLQKLIASQSDEIQLINFWASWCGPCVKELPHFENVSKDGKAEVTLVSLDFPQDKEKAELLLKKKDIKLNSFLLDENDFIDKVEPSWSGAIPATILIDEKGRRYFYEKAFTEKELEELLKESSTK